jgi:DNA-binding NarL/FixJ family response regulator
MTIRVFVLDDHEVVRRGIVELIEVEEDMTVCGEAGTAAEAVERVPGSGAHVAVLDVRLPDGSGVEVCRTLRSGSDQLQCLMLTSFADDEAMLAAIMAGASGYVLKEIRGGDLITAIRTVASGGSLVDPAIKRSVMDRLARRHEEQGRLALLTNRERDILNLIAEGRTNRQISEELFLAEKTVKNYVSNLLMKLGFARRTEAAVYATRLADKAPPDPTP